MAIYSSEEQQTLDNLYSKYQQFSKTYLEQKALYERGLTLLNAGAKVPSGNELKFDLSEIGMPGSLWNASELQNWLSKVKANRDNDYAAFTQAKGDYEAYMNGLTAKYKQQFAFENPQQAAEIEKADIAAKADVEKAKAQSVIDLAKETFAKKNSGYFIIGGIVIVVIAVAGYFYVRSKSTGI